MQEGKSEKGECGTEEKLGDMEEPTITRSDGRNNNKLLFTASGAAKGFVFVAALFNKAATLLLLLSGGGILFPFSASIKRCVSTVLAFGFRLVNVSVRYTFIHRMWRKASAPFNIMSNMLSLKKRRESARNRKNNELMLAVRDGNIREVIRLLSEAEEWRRQHRRSNLRERKAKRRREKIKDFGQRKMMECDGRHRTSRGICNRTTDDGGRWGPSLVDYSLFSSSSDNDEAEEEDLEDAPIANKNCQIPPATRSTPLHVAVERRHQDIVELLIFRFGVDTNRKDTLGRTPLHLAARRLFQPRVVEALLCSHVYDSNDIGGNSSSNNDNNNNNNNEEDSDDVNEKEKRKVASINDGGLNNREKEKEEKAEGVDNAIVDEGRKEYGKRSSGRGRDNDVVFTTSFPRTTTTTYSLTDDNGNDNKTTAYDYDMCEDEEGGREEGAGSGAASLASSVAVLANNENNDGAPTTTTTTTNTTTTTTAAAYTTRPFPPSDTTSASSSFSSISLSPSAKELMRELDDLMSLPTPTTAAVSYNNNNQNAHVQQQLLMSPPSMLSTGGTSGFSVAQAIPADTSIKGPMGNTPLHSAVEAGLPDLVHILLKADGKRWAMIERKIMTTTTNGIKNKNCSCSSLASSCSSSFSPSAFVMSACESSSYSTSPSSSCPPFSSSPHRRSSVALNPSQKEGHLNGSSIIYSTPSLTEILDEAEAQGHISKSDRHFYQNPPIATRNGYGSTPLMLALVYNRTAVAKVLLAHGADINEGLAAFPPLLPDLFKEDERGEKEENQRHKEEQEKEEEFNNQALDDDNENETQRRASPHSLEEKEGSTSRSDVVLVSADDVSGGDGNDGHDDFVILPSNLVKSQKGNLANNKEKVSRLPQFLLNPSEEEEEKEKEDKQILSNEEKEAVRADRRLQIHERMKRGNKTKNTITAQRDPTGGCGGHGLKQQGHGQQGLNEKVKREEEEGKGEEARSQLGQEPKKECAQKEDCCRCSPLHVKGGYDREEVVNTILWHCKTPTLLHMNAGIPHFDNADVARMLIDSGCDPTVRLVKLKKATNIFKNNKLWSFFGGGRGGGGAVDIERDRAETSATSRGGEEVIAEDLVVGLALAVGNGNSNDDYENEGNNNTDATTTISTSATCAATRPKTTGSGAAEEEARGSGSGGGGVAVAGPLNPPPPPASSSYSIARVGIAPIDRALEKGNLKIARVLAAEMPDGAPPAALLLHNDV